MSSSRAVKTTSSVIRSPQRRTLSVVPWGSTRVLHPHLCRLRSGALEHKVDGRRAARGLLTRMAGGPVHGRPRWGAQATHAER